MRLLKQVDDSGNCKVLAFLGPCSISTVKQTGEISIISRETVYSLSLSPQEADRLVNEIQRQRKYWQEYHSGRLK